MQHRRRRGACLQCVKRKQRCDHRWPQCTQCAKHKQLCQLQNFRVSTPSTHKRDRGETSSPKAPSSQFVPEKRTSSTVANEPLSYVLPQVSEVEGRPTSAPSPDIVTDTLLPSNFGDSIVADFSLQSPQPDFSYDSMDFPSPGILSMSTLATASQVAFADSGAAPLPLDDDCVASVGAIRNDTFATGTKLVSLLSTGHRAPFLDMTLDHVYCPMPWPSDMLASSDRRFLWQYFLRIAETDFLCLDWDEVGHLYGFQHPYITTLPQLALANDALRPAIFCFAAAQYELRHGDRRFGRTKALAGSEAALALAGQTARDTDDSDVLALISAATLLHYFGTEGGEYLRLASVLVSRYLARSKTSRSSPTPFPEVPLTEFRWSIVSTLCSLFQLNDSFDAELCQRIEMSEEEIKQNYSQAFKSWVSHPIYTFSPRLVNPLLKIGLLLQTQLRERDGTDVTADPAWASRVTQAEDMLLAARDRDMRMSTSMLGSADPTAVVALNESMYASAAILVYARVQGLPPTAPFIRRQTQIVCDEIAKIPPSSHVSFSIVFPLFVAGCEAVEQHMRDTILERLSELGGVIYDRGDLGGALRHVWGIRDMAPGLPWPRWVSKSESGRPQDFLTPETRILKAH